VYVLSPRPTRIAAAIEAPRTRQIEDAYVIETQRAVLGALGIE
jgi:hypothetical protein